MQVTSTQRGIPPFSGAAASPPPVSGTRDTFAAATAPPRLLPASPPRSQSISPGYNLTYLDPSVRPRDDFYGYALGGYIKSHPIPPDRESFGIRTEVYQRVQDTLHGILEEAAHNGAPAGSVQQKIGDFYASGMDTDTIEAAGMKPLQPMLASIARVSNRQELLQAVAGMHRDGLGCAFDFAASQDMRNAEQMIGEASQGGLGLPGRDYYLDDKHRDVRAAYVDHVAKMFVLMGDDPKHAAAHADTVMALETELAKGSMSRAEMRDPSQLYHMMDEGELQQMTPDFSWKQYFSGLGRPDVGRINVSTPDFFRAFNEQWKTRPLEDWKTYMRWQTVNQTAQYLSKPFEQENFNFKSTILSGVSQMRPRWQTMVGLTDGYLGEALGQKYVEKAFPPQAKARALDMVNNIRAALRDSIVQLKWMGPTTRQEALAKVDTLTVKIGYPDNWKDYGKLQIDRGPFIGNVLRARAFERAEDLNSIGRPVDRGRWGMTPATVNASYNPGLNEIVFPAARLQPPFFDPKADDATNYGATGATIGHELTHGFDDSGSQFDHLGNMRNWWQEDDAARFKVIADGVEHQMSEFEFDGQKCDGKLVEGEALADLGGVELAYAALQKALATKPAPPTLDGFTPQQRFFLSYTLCRESEETKQSAHMQMTNDPHPLGRFRVNGPLANLPQFHEAFGCKPGDPMVRPEEKRHRLWSA